MPAMRAFFPPTALHFSSSFSHFGGGGLGGSGSTVGVVSTGSTAGTFFGPHAATVAASVSARISGQRFIGVEALQERRVSRNERAPRRAPRNGGYPISVVRTNA